MEHSQQFGRSRDEQEKFPWTRTDFPSPGSWARGALTQSLISFSCFFRLAGRVQLSAASPWSMFIPGGQQRPMPILERFPACPSVCRCRVHLSQPRYNHQLSPVRLWLKTVPKFFLLCGNPDFRSIWIFPLPSSESGSLLLYKISPVCLTLHVSKELPQALVSHSLGSLKCFRLCFGTLILIFLGVGAGKGVTGEAAAFPMNVNWAQS